MSEPFLGEIRMMGFNFAPRGWALADGQILPIAQNQSLYSLLGANYGGDGRTSFALPDLRGRTPIHRSDHHPLGQKGGAEAVPLSANEMPAHEHFAYGSTVKGNSRSPTDAVLASEVDPDAAYAPGSALSTYLSSATIGLAGSGEAHENMQPVTTLNFCIALQGLFPSRN